MAPLAWNKSEAKALLKRDIIAGKVTKSTNIDSLWESSVLYKQYKKGNFKTNVRALLNSVEKYQERASRDHSAMKQDFKNFPRPSTTSSGEPIWDGSLAQSMLKRDVATGLHQDMSPKDFWKYREAYQEFTFAKFRKAMYKEKTSANERSYWLNKQQSKKNT